MPGVVLGAEETGVNSQGSLLSQRLRLQEQMRSPRPMDTLWREVKCQEDGVHSGVTCDFKPMSQVLPP